MGQLNKQIAAVTDRIIERSASLRGDYLRQIAEDHNNRPERGKLSCGNLAHGFAACGEEDKNSLKLMEAIPVLMQITVEQLQQLFLVIQVKLNLSKQLVPIDSKHLQAVKSMS